MPVRQPAFFIPHGGGPCFFMPDPAGHWTGMEAFLRSLQGLLLEPPAAILVVSAHWITDGFQLTGGSTPELLYDYYGFPPNTYAIGYNAPGAPELARKAAKLLKSHGLSVELDNERGFDHGVFIPMKVAFEMATIPIVEMSVDKSMDPALHIAAGHALSTLRDEGVLIIGSGMSFHNLGGFGDKRFTAPSEAFDSWLTSTLMLPYDARAARLERWLAAPGSQASHPTAEHLVPLMVAAGASKGPGEKIYCERVLEATVSGFSFN